MSYRIVSIVLMACLALGVGCSKMVPLSQPFSAEQLKVGSRIKATLGDGSVVKAEIRKIEDGVLTLVRPEIVEKGTNPPKLSFFEPLALKISDIQELETSRVDPVRTVVLLIIIVLVLGVVAIILVRRYKAAQATEGG